MGRTIFRHIAGQYVLNVLVLHVLLFAFVVAIDVFINLRRFIGSARDGLDTAGVTDPGPGALALTTAANIADLWWPRLLQLSTHLTGIILIAAMGFTCVQLVRQRELVAMLASGVSLHRLAAPFLAVAVVVAGIQVVNQEMFVPGVAEKLTRSPSEAGQDTGGGFGVQLAPDGQGRYVSANRFDPTTATLTGVSIFERGPTGAVVAVTTADAAAYDRSRHGWLLDNGRRRFTPAGLRLLAAREGPSADASGAAGARTANDANGRARSRPAPSSEANTIDPFAPPDERATDAAASRPAPGADAGAGAPDRIPPALTAAPIAFIASPLDPERLMVQNLTGLAQNLSWRQLGRIIGEPGLGHADRDRLQRIRWGRFGALLSNLLALVATLPFFLKRMPGPMVGATLRACPIALLGLAAAAAAPALGLPGLPPAIAVFVPALVLAPLAVALFTSLKS